MESIQHWTLVTTYIDCLSRSEDKRDAYELYQRMTKQPLTMDTAAQSTSGGDNVAHGASGDGNGLITTRRAPATRARFVSEETTGLDKSDYFRKTTSVALSHGIEFPSQSPSKRMKGDTTKEVEMAQRDFETMVPSIEDDPLETTGKQFVIENATIVSFGSGTITSTSSATGHHDDAHSVYSGITDASSSVNHLRSWLEDSVQQQKKHHENSNSFGSAPPEAVKVTRPRAQKPADLAPKTPVRSFQRKVEPASASRVQATPVRIIKPVHDDVQATNEGYSSVAKLAAWLADDPTKSKKQVTQLRRGANIIAKSRAFDKGLANVIIEESCIRSGTVQREARRRDQGLDIDQQSAESMAIETSSSVSVSHKKQWLESAFNNKKDDSVVDRARSVLVTDREKREDATLRAKQMWRQRTTTPGSKHPARQPEEDPCTRAKEIWRERASRGVSKAVIQTPAKPPAVMTSPSRTMDSSNSSNSSTTTAAANNKSSSNKFVAETPTKQLFSLPNENNPQPQESNEVPEVDFRQARKLLIQRSKQNGHDVGVVNKVFLKKSKFERLERENNERRTSGDVGNGKPRFKARWAESDPANDGRPAGAYVRKYGENPAPKKTFDQLP